MTAALTKLAQDDVLYQLLPIAWTRVMHPKGSGYKTMSDAVIDAVLKYGAAGASGSAGGSPGTQSAGVKCTTGANGNNKFLARNNLNNQIGTFCGVAAQQGVQNLNQWIYWPHAQPRSAVSRYSSNGLAIWSRYHTEHETELRRRHDTHHR